jgi:EAL domain-containing protein (putative c-di-GMP-specific phosphodiesterase class I)/CheY-like chemotaxis protein
MRLQGRLLEPYTLARVGGDTFAVASPRGRDAIATTLPNQVFAALSEPFTAAGQSLHVSVQAGIALFPSDGGDEASLFRNAELALKVARSRGERFAYSSAATNAAVARRARLESELRDALQRHEFVLHYQPRITLESGAVVGSEALIRWQHPARGLLPPGEFIPLAEETGLIDAIGAWVIDRACAQIAAWGKAGLAAVPVAVNVSPVQVEKGDLEAQVRRALQLHAVRPGQLELELTESAVMRDAQAASVTLRAIKAMGCRLVLDDFGTGHSSLAQLKRFPFDAVKIDRSFVTEITSNPDDAAIAAAIIAVARQLRLRVVAEGVETTAQLNYLRTRGCDEIQGFLVGPAVPSDEYEEMLRAAFRFTMPATPAAEERTLLIVDDEGGVRNALQRTLRRDGYRILLAAGGAEALELLAEHPVQVIISDQRMPHMSGTEFLERVRQLHPDTLRIILSGYTDLGVVTDAVNRGAVFRFLTKPWDDTLLREQVRDAFRLHAERIAARPRD